MSEEQNILQWLGSALGLGGAMLWIRFLFTTQGGRISSLEQELTQHKQHLSDNYATHRDVDRLIQQNTTNHQEVMDAIKEVRAELAKKKHRATTVE